jgi:hypothetical protein
MYQSDLPCTREVPCTLSSLAGSATMPGPICGWLHCARNPGKVVQAQPFSPELCRAAAGPGPGLGGGGGTTRRI